MPSLVRDLLGSITPDRGAYHRQDRQAYPPRAHPNEDVAWINPYDEEAYAMEKTRCNGASEYDDRLANGDAALMEKNPSGSSGAGGASSTIHSGKQRPPLIIPPGGHNMAAADAITRLDSSDSPVTPATTLIHGHASSSQDHASSSSGAGVKTALTTGHARDQSVATVTARSVNNRVSQYSQVAPTERTRITSALYPNWPQRPEPITAVLTIWQHFLWVFGTLGVVSGAGALGVFVCLHLDVSSAAWLVYIIVYFLLSFFFFGIMGTEMRIFAERKWRKILEKLSKDSEGIHLNTTRRPEDHREQPDNGHISSEGNPYQLGDLGDETMATDVGETYALVESRTKRQSVAFKTPDKPSPIKETHESGECYVPAYSYEGYGSIATTSPGRKNVKRASRV